PLQECDRVHRLCTGWHMSGWRVARAWLPLAPRLLAFVMISGFFGFAQWISRLIVHFSSENFHYLGEYFGSSPIFVVAFHDGPGRSGGTGLHQHFFDSFLVSIPLVAIAPVFFGQLPCLVPDGLALFKA